MPVPEKENFVNYISRAKSLVANVSVPDYEKFFSDPDIFAPVFSQLEQLVYVIDFRSIQFLYVSPNAEHVNGYQMEEIIEMGPMKFMELFHERDYDIIVNKIFAEGLGTIKELGPHDLSKVKIAYSFRLKQKDAAYKMLINQFTHMMEDEEGNPLVIMGTITDITDIQSKPEIFGRITHQTSKGKWVKIYERFFSLAKVTSAFDLTPKELEIIQFVNKGLSSKEIAKLTNRSEETIKSQRKSILAKTKCQTMTEVIVLGHKHGWLH